jgi:RecA-family ATPase
VFARDADALLDMIELPVSEALAKAEADRMTRALCHAALKKSIMGIDPEKALSQDDQCSAVRSLAACERLMAPFEYTALLEQIAVTKARLAKRTAWRIEGTLREFARFPPVNVWFDYPVHTSDRAGVLQDAQPESEKPWYERGKEKRRKKIEHQKNGYLIDIQNALDTSGADAIAIDDLTLTNAKGERINPKTIKGWLGNGNQAQDDLKKVYEKFMGEDGRAWLRRRIDADTDE